MSTMPRVSRATGGMAADRDIPDTADTVTAGAQTAAEPDEAPVGRAPAWVRLWWTPLVLFAVIGLLAAGAGLRTLIDRPPADTSVDVGFARDMSEHHSQAVQMAMVEFNNGSDAVTRSVAQDIALSQQQESGIMATWLASWGRPPTSAREPMAWMPDHGGTTGEGDATAHSEHEEMTTATGTEGLSVRMPGMATEAELAQFARSSGHDLDILFLTLMIRHHRGGVDMAQYASLHAQEDKVRALARVMVINQSKEIENMQLDLERLGAPRA